MKDTYAKATSNPDNQSAFELYINCDSRKIELTWTDDIFMFADVVLTGNDGKDITELEDSIRFICDKIKDAIISTRHREPHTP